MCACSNESQRQACCLYYFSSVCNSTSANGSERGYHSDRRRTASFNHTHLANVRLQIRCPGSLHHRPPPSDSIRFSPQKSAHCYLHMRVYNKNEFISADCWRVISPTVYGRRDSHVHYWTPNCKIERVSIRDSLFRDSIREDFIMRLVTVKMLPHNELPLGRPSANGLTGDQFAEWTDFVACSNFVSSPKV